VGNYEYIEVDKEYVDDNKLFQRRGAL